MEPFKIDDLIKDDDAIQEQQTEEVSVGELPEDSQEMGEGGEEPQQSDEAQEALVENEDTANAETSEQVESQIQNTDYGIDEEYIELARSLKDDEYIANAVKYYKENKTLKPYLEAYQFDYNDVDDLRLLEMQFNGENPELSEKARKRLFEKEVLAKYRMDDEIYDDDELELGQELLKRDAKRLREKFIENQKNFIPENLPQGPTPEQIAAQRQEELRIVQQGLKNYTEGKKIQIETSEGVPLNYEIPNPENLVDLAVDTEKFWGNFTTDNGEVNWDLWAKTMSFIQDPNGFVNELVKHGKSLGRKSIEEELKNPGEIVNKRDSVGNDAATPFDDPEGFLKFVASTIK
jgi:hypothetical protein